MIQLSLQCGHINFVSALMVLNQHFKLVSKSLPDPEESETLHLARPLATTKAFNKAELADSKQLQDHHGITVFMIIWFRQTS